MKLSKKTTVLKFTEDIEIIRKITLKSCGVYIVRGYIFSYKGQLYFTRFNKRWYLNMWIRNYPRMAYLECVKVKL